jgi:hypothetical protein
MPEAKRGRPQSAPDFDRVVEAISSGKYDERILEIHDALSSRRDVLREQLLVRVREVFGPEAEVVMKQAEVAKNLFVQKAKERSRDAEPIAEGITGLDRSHQYRVNPDDNNLYRLEKDYGNGMIAIVDDFGDHRHDIPKIEWDGWRLFDNEDNSEAEELPAQDQVTIGDVPLDRRGPMIGGMSASMMGN